MQKGVENTMSIFSIYPPREEFVRRSYEVDISLYENLEKLSNERYDASINKLVNTSLEHLLNTKKLDLYKRNKNEITVPRSFLIRKSLHKGMLNLKNEYNISLNKIINIALYNALVDEGLIKRN